MKVDTRWQQLCTNKLLKCIDLMDIFFISLQISLEFVSRGAMLQLMALCQTGDKTFSQRLVTKLLHMDGLMQKIRNSCALTMELLILCIKSLICVSLGLNMFSCNVPQPMNIKRIDPIRVFGLFNPVISLLPLYLSIYLAQVSSLTNYAT